MSPRRRNVYELPPRRVWTIDVVGTRATDPRVRALKSYRITSNGYQAAADAARRAASLAGLVDVTIVGVRLEVPTRVVPEA